MTDATIQLMTSTRMYPAGDHNSTARQAAMLDMTGIKLPKSKCGANVVRSTMIEKLGVTGNCMNARDMAALDALKAMGGVL